ncbi:MAG TPA: hypothetical protein V6D22_23800, partial [Candidatus Obscuribacterales bacterium]
MLAAPLYSAEPLYAAEPAVDGASSVPAGARPLSQQQQQHVPTSAPGENASSSAATNASGASTSATTSGGSNASTNDGIPDTLNEVLPKDVETIPAATSVLPGASQHSPDQSSTAGSRPPVQGTTSPGSRPPLHTTAPSTSAQSASVTAGVSAHAEQKKPASPQVLLKGRLEEVAGSGARLPVGVMLNLKTQTAHMDPAVEKQLAGKVGSFPSDWAGSYGGTITIWSTQFDPAAYQFDPEETQEEQKIEAAGTQGTTSFNFFRQNNIIALQPATIMLPPRNDSPMARQMQEQLRSSPMGQMLGGNGGAMLSMLTQTQPMMVLGEIRGGTGVTGNALQNVVVKNDIRQLKQGVLEQNLIVQESERHHETGQVKRTYSETVLRFTRLNPQQLYVQAASIKYRHDGHFLSKVIMFGTMTKGVGGGNPMSGFPTGSFPGLDPSGASGAGGFGQLNDMLKQLQGF